MRKLFDEQAIRSFSRSEGRGCADPNLALLVGSQRHQRRVEDNVVGRTELHLILRGLIPYKRRQLEPELLVALVSYGQQRARHLRREMDLDRVDAEGAGVGA